VRHAVLAVCAVVASVVAVGCGGSSATEESSGGDGVRLTLVAYSTPREVYEQLTDAFAATEAGRGVTFEESYGSSGEQSRAVEAGLPAHVVAFSLEPDVTRLVEAGLVDEGWQDDEYGGMVTRSVVVFAVRKGNPKRIDDWDDLVRPGVEVVTPNPFTSGGARWNVMAAYGAQLEAGRGEGQAVDYLRKLFRNVSVQDKSAREALQTFVGGKGDVMLAYENEAILARTKGEELDYVVPERTILIENPVAVTADAPDEAAAFVEYLRSPGAQRVFGRAGYRPVADEVGAEFDYPEPSGLFEIDRFGGWPAVQERFFDREDGIMAEIQRDLGEPLE
jgi:sulfate/thiosulfate transport system substrate-binding protein